MIVPSPGFHDGRFRLVGLVPNQGDNHAVQVEEKENQMETELRERFLFVPHCKHSETNRSVDCQLVIHTFLCTLSFRKISVASRRCVLSTILPEKSVSQVHAVRGRVSPHTS